MTGSPSNRTTMRSGRTPPFIILALLIVVGFLSYNYWKFYNENLELRSEIETVRVQARDLDKQKLDSEVNLNTAREEIKQVQGSRDQLQKQKQEKETELNNVREEMKKKQEELDGVKKSMATCDGNLQAKSKEVETLTGQKAAAEKSLEEEKAKTKVCDLKACSDTVKQILEITTKLAGTDAVKAELTAAGLDAATLLEKVSQHPAPKKEE